MKLSELIIRLSELRDDRGDVDVFIRDEAGALGEVRIVTIETVRSHYDPRVRRIVDEPIEPRCIISDEG